MGGKNSALAKAFEDPANLGILKETFDKLDKDKGGFLEEKEAKKFFKELLSLLDSDDFKTDGFSKDTLLGDQRESEYIEAAYDKMDANKDGQASFEEFIRFAKGLAWTTHKDAKFSFDIPSTWQLQQQGHDLHFLSPDQKAGDRTDRFCVQYVVSDKSTTDVFNGYLASLVDEKTEFVETKLFRVSNKSKLPKDTKPFEYTTPKALPVTAPGGYKGFTRSYRYKIGSHNYVDEVAVMLDITCGHKMLFTYTSSYKDDDEENRNLTKLGSFEMLWRKTLKVVPPAMLPTAKHTFKFGPLKVGVQKPYGWQVDEEGENKYLIGPLQSLSGNSYTDQIIFLPLQSKTCNDVFSELKEGIKSPVKVIQEEQGHVGERPALVLKYASPTQKFAAYAVRINETVTLPFIYSSTSALSEPIVEQLIAKNGMTFAAAK